jgi:hypothetical protein
VLLRPATRCAGAAAGSSGRLTDVLYHIKILSKLADVRRALGHVEFLAEQQHRILSQLRILRDDIDVLVASARRIDNSYDRLENRLESRFAMLLDELRETRTELRALGSAAESPPRLPGILTVKMPAEFPV